MAQETAPRQRSGIEKTGQRDRERTSLDLVPSRRQYLDLKARHQRAILLYRMGDFYETFDDDAVTVARDARISLTSRSFGRSGRIPMAGLPYHALNHYLGRLLAAGHTVAIAEQVSEAGRGLVDRAVTRVISPGTIAEPALLPAGENRYLAAVCQHGARWGLSWADVSTGEFGATEFTGDDARQRLDEELARLDPAECLVPDEVGSEISNPGHRTRLARHHFLPSRATTALVECFGGRSLAPMGIAEQPAATGAAGAIVAYLEQTNPALLPLLTGIRSDPLNQVVGLDAATRANLELTRSHRTGGSRGSLLGVLDQTRTPMGSRTLRQLINRPLRDLSEITRRQQVIAALVERPAVRAQLAGHLAVLGDAERLIGRAILPTTSARELCSLATALRVIPAITNALLATEQTALVEFANALDCCRDVLELIDRGVCEDAEGRAQVRPGYDEALDTARERGRSTREWLTSLERQERERTGIRSLKVGFNKVFGYYIEVTRPNLDLVPTEYTRKQTIANGERFVTAPLKDAEARLLANDEELELLERQALSRLAADVAVSMARLTTLMGNLARLDAFTALAEVAAQCNWCAPTVDESERIEIVGGRHPVVEANLAGQAFIANDLRLGEGAARVLVVTGPNMGGKSTYLRQAALIVLLAQIGSFVPAESARIGLVDRIFTRVGAHDDLAGGASTFMVEMVETATILRQATRQSLIVLDEVGRGTGTDDGLAIAQAVLEDLHERIGARTLFATHYLELTALEGQFPNLSNVHVAALETGSEVIFLYAVRPGAADRAYGIQVARLAGLPCHVADRAEDLLGTHQSAAAAEPPPAGERAQGDGTHQLPLDGFPARQAARDRVLRALRDLDLEHLTPREALDWLHDQQSQL